MQLAILYQPRLRLQTEPSTEEVAVSFQMPVQQQTKSALASSHLMITQKQLHRPLYGFMLPHLTATMRLNLRATCMSMLGLVDTDIDFWVAMEMVEPKLVTEPWQPAQTQRRLMRQSRLKWQGQMLACMRGGQPIACLVMPRPISSCQPAGHHAHWRAAATSHTAALIASAAKTMSLT